MPTIFPCTSCASQISRTHHAKMHEHQHRSQKKNDELCYCVTCFILFWIVCLIGLRGPCKDRMACRDSQQPFPELSHGSFVPRRASGVSSATWETPSRLGAWGCWWDHPGCSASRKLDSKSVRMTPFYKYVPKAEQPSMHMFPLSQTLHDLIYSL